MRIKILDKELANQIAAGEVVERPASVVKELVENSLDAKARKITVEIRHGGQELIRVIDNGEGILKEDLTLALARHATSKISKLADLEEIHSLGFRGEALASICAVSQLSIVSHHHGADMAWGIVNNDLNAPEPCAHPIGTTIEVKNLFYNTPARRKFLRQPKTEFRQIESMLHKLALSRLDVGFELIHNQRVIFSLPSASNQETISKRIACILGQEFLDNAFFMEFKAAEFSLNGWLGLPAFHRSQSDMQYWFLNGRYVRDKALSHAARHAYEDVLYNQRYPAYILYLNCDPATVDVNVHPTKQEVRFRDSRSLHQFIVHGIKTALEKIAINPAHGQSPLLGIKGENHDSPPPAPMRRGCNPPFSPPRNPIATTHAVQEQLAVYEYITTLIEQPNQAKTESIHNLHLGTALAQLKNTFILAQNDQGLVIIDIHAAHERLQYEKLKKEGHIIQKATQPLLIPLTMALSTEEYQIWEEHQEQFLSAGINTSALNETSILIREIPVLFAKIDICRLIHDFLSDLSVLPASQKIPELWHELLGNIACKNSLKTNEKLTLQEMDALLREMEITPNSSQCNHGRPTWKQFNWSELDRFFLRGR